MRLIIKTWTSKVSFVVVETCQIFYLMIISKTRFYGLERSISERKSKKLRYLAVLRAVPCFKQLKHGKSACEDFGCKLSLIFLICFLLQVNLSVNRQ